MESAIILLGTGTLVTFGLLLADAAVRLTAVLRKRLAMASRRLANRMYETDGLTARGMRVVNRLDALTRALAR